MKNIEILYQSENNQIISYLKLRKFIGIIGIFLPIILPLVLIIFKNEDFIQDSISDYYGTEARDYFVGFMFALGLFLLTYKGYKFGNDNLFANLGAVFALGVALFPTTSEYLSIRIIHLSSAGLLFAVFAYFCLVIFKRTKPGGKPTDMKKTRNKFYTIC
ncbi:hypothetical protein H9I45_04490 [Polaribacter haliotis]|uniref:DUF998 domain-containing protein n=1 Tax=Polaribacter haliotis TaxID=1888915 RepID=A0A7L8AIE8_9FLAO|nr:hypothetical protein [Polaribacter haliotis]QOD61714.1 hypothetical protein H9I45_04490 [Polaribacter haliotis]